VEAKIDCKCVAKMGRETNINGALESVEVSEVGDVVDAPVVGIAVELPGRGHGDSSGGNVTELAAEGVISGGNERGVGNHGIGDEIGGAGVSCFGVGDGLVSVVQVLYPLRVVAAVHCVGRSVVCDVLPRFLAPAKVSHVVVDAVKVRSTFAAVNIQELIGFIHVEVGTEDSKVLLGGLRATVVHAINFLVGNRSGVVFLIGISIRVFGLIKIGRVVINGILVDNGLRVADLVLSGGRAVPGRHILESDGLLATLVVPALAD